jgi:hypothetical protein
MLNLYHANDDFAVAVGLSEMRTDIVMELYHSRVTTRYFPETTAILDRYLPSIFRSKCFNDEGNTFRTEVKRTEIGHLFEHILLEYLCLVKREKGLAVSPYNGSTRWDWDTDTRGTFHITIDSGTGDKEIFSIALDRSIQLLLRIIAYK